MLHAHRHEGRLQVGEHEPYVALVQLAVQTAQKRASGRIHALHHAQIEHNEAHVRQPTGGLEHVAQQLGRRPLKQEALQPQQVDRAAVLVEKRLHMQPVGPWQDACRFTHA
eukprot:3780677-Prymnesium_polylepis.2